MTEISELKAIATEFVDIRIAIPQHH